MAGKWMRRLLAWMLCILLVMGDASASVRAEEAAGVQPAAATEENGAAQEETAEAVAADTQAAAAFKLSDWTYTLSGTECLLETYQGSETSLRLAKSVTVSGTSYTVAISKSTDYGAIRELSFEAGFVLPADCTNLFYNKTALTGMDFTGVSTSHVTNMYGMFDWCTSLTSLNVSGFDTGNVTNMMMMFNGLENLTGLDVSSFDTRKVTTMFHMFDWCSSLTSLDVSGFDTGNVTSMYHMFYQCVKLESLDVSGWDTGKVTNMESMFFGCENLAGLDVSGWNTGRVTNMEHMFWNCKALTSLDVSGWDTSRVTNMGNMFCSCKGLQSLDVSGWNTSRVTNMEVMFSGCSSLMELDVSGWDTGKVEHFNGTFSGCKSLTELDVSGWDTHSGIYMTGMFGSCSGLTELDVSGFDTGNVTTMGAMFSGCSGLTSLDLSSFDMSKVSADNAGQMLSGCKGLQYIDVPLHVSSGALTDLYTRFYSVSGESYVHLPTGVNESFRIYRRYTVTWVIDGSSEQEYYLYSFMPEHEDPVKEGDGHHTYVFTGWTPEITAVTGNATYTAVFEEIPEMYTVTWLNWDGSLLETDEVAYGEMPAYHGETPSREDEPGVRYTFAGWTPELAAVTGDAAYTALFDAEHVHEWGEPEYVWGEFDRSVTATRRCRFDESHVESETVEASYAVIQFATCEESGSGIWTSAAFENPAFEVQTKVVEIPALGHEWCEPEYVWGEFDHSVTATRTCKNDESHVESETVAASYAVIQAATCEESGSGIWTSAAFENPAFEVQTKVVEIPALGHDWKGPEWTWAEDYSRAEAAFVCANDDTHVMTLDAEVMVEEGSGEDEGYLIYTAAVTGPDGETYTDVVRAEKPVTQEILRVYGNTRYKTGLAIAEEYKKESGAEKFDAVILATGDGFADALAGSYLAYQKKAPILLTRARDVSLVNGYIRENLEAGGTVYVLGGEKAFPEEWLAGLEGFAVKRISGSTRYNTGAEILKEAGVAAGEEVLICTGENFADSLSVSSSGKPLFLVKESLNKNQKALLAELAAKGCTFTILGGEKAVTPAMADLIRAEVGDALASERIAGSTRYRTSAILAERYFPNAWSIVLATGQDYPDGLCGGPLGALRGAPIVLTRAGQEKAARDYASVHRIQAGVVLGGPKIISDEMARSILGLDESVEVTEMFYK